jgi:transposase
MPQNFIACDREQELLLPANLKEWLPEDHLAWFVLAAVEEMDVSAFLAAYRADGHGRPAHEPAMMLALLLYAYCKGQRSSRVIEREQTRRRSVGTSRRHTYGLRTSSVGVVPATTALRFSAR